MESSQLQNLPYLTDFGLQRDPFSLAIEDDFFFNDSAHAQNLDLLQHALLSNELFMLVTGQFGIGKTILIRRLLSRIDDNYQVCFIHANPMHHVDQLKQQIYKGLGTDSSSESISGFDQLTLYLDNIKRSGKTSLLIIDDAHELSIESMQLIMSLNEITSNNTPLLSIILFAEPDVKRLLEMADPQKAQRLLTQNLELQALSEKDTANYLHLRMKVAGFNEDNLTRTPFTPSVIETIYKNSKGIPFEINRQASKILIRMSGNEQDVIAPAPTKKGRLTAASTLVIILVLAILVAVIAVQDTINSFFESVSSTSTNDNSVSIPENKIQREKIVSLIEPKTEITAESKPDTTTITRVPIVPEKVAESTDPQSIITMRNKKQDSDIISLPERDETDQNRNMIDLLKDNQSDMTPPSVNADQEVIKKQDIATKPAEETTPEETTDEKIIEKSILIEKEVSPVVTTSQTPEENIDVIKKDWLFEQKPQHYTVQILGAKQKSTIDKFLSQNTFNTPPTIYTTTKSGNEWHMVFTGTYPDKNSAQQFVKTLPEKLQQSRPWIRTISDIQLEVMRDNSKATESVISVAKQPLHTDSWFLEQNPWHYTIQLLGSANRSSLNSFVNRHHLQGKASYFKTRRNDKDWYVLVYGVYPSEQTARQALAELPAALKSTSPWPRILGSVHTAIIEAQ